MKHVCRKIYLFILSPLSSYVRCQRSRNPAHPPAGRPPDHQRDGDIALDVATALQAADALVDGGGGKIDESFEIYERDLTRLYENFNKIIDDKEE